MGNFTGRNFTRRLYKYKLLTISLITLSIYAKSVDENLWLENIDSKDALVWVKKINQQSEEALTKDPIYPSLFKDAMEVLNRGDKLPLIFQQGNWIYNYWKDKSHPRGIYRRTTISSFKSATPNWQTVLDIDRMSGEDNIKWVFKKMNCLKPEYIKCLVSLSPGGGDAIEVREFDAQTLNFVKDGFYVPKAKTAITWIDENHLYIGSDFGPDSMTDSGYPGIQKIWQRGTSIAQAKSIIKVDKKSVSSGVNHYSDDMGTIDIITDNVSFWTRRYWQLLNDKAIKLDLPETAQLVDMINGQLIVQIKQDWNFLNKKFKQGSILLIKPATLRGEKGTVTVLAEENPKAIIEDVVATSRGILVITLEDVKSRIYFYENNNGIWKATQVALPASGQISIASLNHKTGEFFARYEDFLTPPTLYLVDEKLNVEKIRQQSATFDSSPFKVQQFFTKSRDGTEIPYFVVMNRQLKFNGKNPTYIFSYGGFRSSLTPSYSGSYEDLNGAYGKMWLQRGGVFVLANIRGGGEYGPAWHASALLEKRSRSFEDFEAVAEDLIDKKITSSQHLGIEGRSNGGLLVAATMTRRPELYGAVICGVPLLDMKRYHKLLAGTSWMAEFGNPDTDDWEFIKSYSPYHNIYKDIEYPPVFFFTSTRDDRVHPGHARKMAARLIAHDNKVEYYENMEGGHKGSSTTEQMAKRIAMGYTHLWKELR